MYLRTRIVYWLIIQKVLRSYNMNFILIRLLSLSFNVFNWCNSMHYPRLFTFGPRSVWWDIADTYLFFPGRLICSGVQESDRRRSSRDISHFQSRNRSSNLRRRSHNLYFLLRKYFGIKSSILLTNLMKFFMMMNWRVLKIL